MNANMIRKGKQVAFIGFVALAFVWGLNTLANRFTLAKKAQAVIGSGS